MLTALARFNVSDKKGTDGRFSSTNNNSFSSSKDNVSVGVIAGLSQRENVCCV